MGRKQQQQKAPPTKRPRGRPRKTVLQPPKVKRLAEFHANEHVPITLPSRGLTESVLTHTPLVPLLDQTANHWFRTVHEQKAKSQNMTDSDALRAVSFPTNSRINHHHDSSSSTLSPSQQQRQQQQKEEAPKIELSVHNSLQPDALLFVSIFVDEYLKAECSSSVASSQLAVQSSSTTLSTSSTSLSSLSSNVTGDDIILQQNEKVHHYIRLLRNRYPRKYLIQQYFRDHAVISFNQLKVLLDVQSMPNSTYCKIVNKLRERKIVAHTEPIYLEEHRHLGVKRPLYHYVPCDSPNSWEHVIHFDMIKRALSYIRLHSKVCIQEVANFLSLPFRKAKFLMCYLSNWTRLVSFSIMSSSSTDVVFRCSVSNDLDALLAQLRARRSSVGRDGSNNNRRDDNDEEEEGYMADEASDGEYVPPHMRPTDVKKHSAATLEPEHTVALKILDAYESAAEVDTDEEDEMMRGASSSHSRKRKKRTKRKQKGRTTKARTPATATSKDDTTDAYSSSGKKRRKISRSSSSAQSIKIMEDDDDDDSDDNNDRNEANDDNGGDKDSGSDSDGLDDELSGILVYESAGNMYTDSDYSYMSRLSQQETSSSDSEQEDPDIVVNDLSQHISTVVVKKR